MFKFSFFLSQAFALQAIDVGSNEHNAPSHKRQSGQIAIVGGVPDPSAGMLYLSDPLPAINAPVVAVDDGVDLVADDAPVVMASGPSLFSVQRPVLEPMQLPPVVDVYPEVPDRVGDTPLQVWTSPGRDLYETFIIITFTKQIIYSWYHRKMS